MTAAALCLAGWLAGWLLHCTDHAGQVAIPSTSAKCPTSPWVQFCCSTSRPGPDPTNLKLFVCRCSFHPSVRKTYSPWRVLIKRGILHRRDIDASRRRFPRRFPRPSSVHRTFGVLCLKREEEDGSAQLPNGRRQNSTSVLVLVHSGWSRNSAPNGAPLLLHC